MFTLTAEAAEAINNLVANQPSAGLRISSQSEDGDRIQLGLSLTDQPAPSDQVIEEQGTHVFLAEDVAPLLDGKTLDARITDDQEVSFRLLP
jgi:Fe-S cluster assembly iron-binding protein IscA